MHKDKTHSKNAKNKERKDKFKQVFWKPHNKANGQPTYLIGKALLSDYLENNGYKRQPTFGDDYAVIQLTNNIAHSKTKLDIYNDLLEVVKLEDDSTLLDCYIEQGETLILSKLAILGGLPTLNLKRYRDNKDCVRLFYKDKIAVITKDSIKTETYKQFTKLDTYIFSEQIINRNFNSDFDCKNDTDELSDFHLFLQKATNGKEHFKSVCSAIGYLVSSYKNPSIAKAIIITDLLSQIKNEAFGRTGKGLIIKALSYIINVVEFNGKATNLMFDRFVFQNVSPITALVVLQDVSKGFVFESLFSTLTDTMSIEQKHKAKISIPFESSPKVAITTNHTIPQDSDSYKDRKHVLTLNNKFSAEYKPEDFLGRLLFDVWDESDWQKFDRFIIKCVRIFLHKGLLNYEDKNIKQLQLINQTSKDFVDEMNARFNKKPNKYFNLKDIAKGLDFGTDEPRAKGKILSGWLDIYAACKSLKIDKRISGGITKIRLFKDD